MRMRRREFLLAGAAVNVGAVVTLAQSGPAPGRGGGRGGGGVQMRKATTTRMFKSPGMYPNALAVMPDAPGGIWIGQQKIQERNTKTYNLPLEKDRDEAAWLVDWNGKLIKTVMTQSRNTSGMAYGDGCVWMGSNEEPYGIFQVDMNGKQLSHRQIPLSIDDRGGGNHGVKWHNGKLWIAALRLGGILRVDPKSWVPEVLIRVSSPERPRLHDVAFDNEGNIWVVTGDASTSYAEGQAAINKYDGRTGALLMVVVLAPGSCDPHGRAGHEGRLISCDAGIHPGWKGLESPHSGYIFSINIA